MPKIRLSLPKSVIKALKEQQDQDEMGKVRKDLPLNNPKQCKVCNTPFTPTKGKRTTQLYCSDRCKYRAYNRKRKPKNKIQPSKSPIEEGKQYARIELLKLCLLYVRCRDCKRVMPRQKMRGCSMNHCAICRASKIDFRDSFREWYENRGKNLDKILPNPMPRLGEVKRLLRQAQKGK